MQPEIGEILTGKVTGVTDFGAFIELEGGATGMVHISEVSTTYVKNIREHLEINQSVRVKVISISDNGKINLSIKKAVADENPGAQQSFDRPRSAAPRKPGGSGGGSRRGSSANVWQGSPQNNASTQGQSFEEMMTRFKQVSDEKFSDLKRSSETRHGGGYARKGNKS